MSVIPKMESSVTQARLDARALVRGKLALLDELARRLLSAVPSSRHHRPETGEQDELL
jgi:hypothetical protein